MGTLRIVLLTDADSLNQRETLPYKYHGQKLWELVRNIVERLKYRCELVDLHKLDFQEEESVNKYLNADIVMMDVTNPERRPTFMYHKGNRESMDCNEDIVLIQASGVENDTAIHDLKTTCKIKRLIVYRYDEIKDIFYDTTQPSTPMAILEENLTCFLERAADHIQQGLADRYITRMNVRKAELQNDNAFRDFLWKEICDEVLTEVNQAYATPKLIIQLMYSFRDTQDYESMIRLVERCEQLAELSKKINNNMIISYLHAFARSRRNQDNDRDEALTILQRLCATRKTESELSNDILCLCGRIYKDKFNESMCQDQEALENAIDWYRKGFAADPNIYAGINLLFLLAIKVEDVKRNEEAYRIIIQLNALLGKKGRALKDLTDYWDLATYFELHAVQSEWQKACLAALYMYLRDPPIWYMKSTINNLKMLHQATRIIGQQKSREPKADSEDSENVYSFWIDFFTDAIDSTTNPSNEKQLPAQIPILICDNYERNDGTAVKNVYVESHLQLNFHTGSEPETLVIRTLEKNNRSNQEKSERCIEMNSIKSIINVKRDNRSVFLYAYENAEAFLSVEVQIFFSSAERRAAFNDKMSKYRLQTNVPETEEKFDLLFERDSHEQRTSLGQGTYGKVYIAHDRYTWKKFAVKEIPMRNPVYTDVLENEIKILATLNHRNIVTYYGSSIDRSKKQPVFQIIMEYVDGGNLSQHLAKFGQFQEPVIRNYTKQLLEGLQYLHENHILHRDIKSANILVNSKGEIKIADFGTSKRLAGLQLCTEDSVGTLQYMSPDVVLVPPIGYGPEVDIWSVGCTVIEMATGKLPFHKVANPSALLLKLGNERQAPDIPSELSDLAKDFLSKCFESTDKRPSAKDLLNHPFFKVKTPLPRQISGTVVEKGREKIEIMVTEVPPTNQRRDSSDESDIPEPSPTLNEQISIDDGRRSELVNILRNNDSREMLLGRWMDLIDEKNETDILTIEKLRILLSSICDYLESSQEENMKTTLNEICDLSTMDSDSRTDLERAFYFFIKAANSVLMSQNSLAPHVLFALDNVIRRVVEYLVSLIRPDFVSASNSVTPKTPNDQSLLSPMSTRPGVFESINTVKSGEIAELEEQYLKLNHKTREHLKKLIHVEERNGTILADVIENEDSSKESSSSRTSLVQHIFQMIYSFTRKLIENIIPAHYLSHSANQISEQAALLNPAGYPQSTHTSPFQTLMHTRNLVALEEENEKLIRSILENRMRFNQLLDSINKR